MDRTYGSDSLAGGWIAVACAEHVLRGIAGGFMQVCHGKPGPLQRIKAGDRVAYYAPGDRMGGPANLQQFVAFGIVRDGPVVQVEMAPGFRPWRRSVRWLDATPAPIRPLLDRPGFALTRKDWGARLRFGLLRIDADSIAAIAEAMRVGWPHGLAA